MFIVYVDCDVFYVVVEKRDNLDLVDKLVIIGGGKRGVVLIVCYMVWFYGVYLVMFMFKVFKVCLNVVVLVFKMNKYVEVSWYICVFMVELIFIVEFLLIDEVFLDLIGMECLYG